MRACVRACALPTYLLTNKILCVRVRACVSACVRASPTYLLTYKSVYMGWVAGAETVICLGARARVFAGVRAGVHSIAGKVQDGHGVPHGMGGGAESDSGEAIL